MNYMNSRHRTSTSTSAKTSAKTSPVRPVHLVHRGVRVSTSAASKRCDSTVGRIVDFLDKLHAARSPLEKERSQRLAEVTEIIKTVATEEIKWLKELRSTKRKTDHVASVAEVITTPREDEP